MMYDNSVAAGPGPLMGGLDKQQVTSAHALQQKMHRQRQLALERQRSTARKQLGAGVIASANPLLQSSGLKGAQWGTSLPDGLLASPVKAGGILGSGAAPGGDLEGGPKSGALGKEKDALSELENSTQGNGPPKEKRDLSKGKGGISRIDTMDGLAEELLLDEKLPAVQKQSGASPRSRNQQLGPRSGTEAQKGPEATNISLRADSPAVSPHGGLGGMMSSSPSRHSNAGWASGEANGGGNAWGGSAPLQQAGPPRQNRGNVESVEEVGAVESFNPGAEVPVSSTSMSGPGSRRKRQSNKMGAGDEDGIEVYGAPPKRSESPLHARPSGKFMDLNVESQARKKEEKKAGGLGSWLFGGGSSAVPTVNEEVEVTQVSAFTFD